MATTLLSICIMAWGMATQQVLHTWHTLNTKLQTLAHPPTHCAP